MNDTPKGERLHIALFGKRNAGKSSLVNAITNQELSIVSKVKGTTTDPVYKAMEILPIGPVMFVDTPGLDDEGELGRLRLEKAKDVLGKADVVLIVVDGSDADDLTLEYALEEELKKKRFLICGYTIRQICIWIRKKDIFGLVQKVEKEYIT